MAKKPNGNDTLEKQMENVYATSPFDFSKGKTTFRENWFKQKPYAFQFTPRKGNPQVFNLPIAPSNLNIVTHFATNVISTMYGTVEEHSEQRYYDITISGTTGMAPKYYKPGEAGTESIPPSNFPTSGRAGYAVKDSFTNKGSGFAKRTLSLISSVTSSVEDLFGLKDAPTSGIDLNATGYIAFHNFYKFLLVYKKDASGESSTKRRVKHPFKFINYKDNNEYDVAIQNFNLTRDAGNPMLYSYNITMRAYNLRDVTSVINDTDTGARLEALGLDGIKTSLFSIMANKTRQAKNAGYAAIAAVKGAGS